MGFFDRLFGTNSDDTASQRQAQPAQGRQSQRSDDEIAVERYRYLLRTAPPETIEGVHREAFSKLTPEQRELLFTELSKNAPQGDAPRSSDAAALATSATRSELRQPGTMERSMGGGGMGFGSMVASSLLGTVAGYVIGSALVSAFLPTDTGSADASGEDAAADDTASADSADASADGGGDFGGGDFGGGDFGGGFDF
ncbi:hypothetical protein HD599_003525 [Conyzicola lurida]|uniref:Uncharacterized protein n=1 Tax=Conyzicola lurida TaxID=1172621 RepID=A0A841ATD3_9MICO|nr:hypothetical protein [Conyzicola lurida]MBB5845202.1 hypothetical protein [Conyzicola lurida]